jgi:hypothetical protein
MNDDVIDYECVSIDLNLVIIGEYLMCLLS